MNLKLSGKKALVTGSSRGLGFATALNLAREGCLVGINGRDIESLSIAASSISVETGSQIITLAGDLTDPDYPAILVDQFAKASDGIDILVTNTGGPPAGRFENFDDHAWQEAIDLNLMSHVRLIRAALPYLRLSPAASVLTITSYSVKQPIPNLVLSNSIRAATIGLTKTLALELGSEGIRFNSLLPAWTETERALELLANRARMNQTTVEEEVTKQAKESPFGRLATPEEFANVAVFLVSPVASFVTGVMLTVDGGMYRGIY